MWLIVEKVFATLLRKCYKHLWGGSWINSWALCNAQDGVCKQGVFTPNIDRAEIEKFAVDMHHVVQ